MIFPKTQFSGDSDWILQTSTQDKFWTTQLKLVIFHTPLKNQLIESKNHPIEKENHLEKTFKIFGLHVNHPRCNV